MTINAIRPGKYLKTSHTHKVFILVKRIAFEVQAQKCFYRLPVGKLARRLVGTAKQNNLIAVHATNIQSVAMSHSVIVTERGGRWE